MLPSYPMTRTTDVAQFNADTTFCGGLPKLPRYLALPKCKLCGADLTFFFQIKLPHGHQWEGNSFAVFGCTECADEDHLIPPMITGQLKGVAIPAGFLESYQKNFAVYVFPDRDAVLRDDYLKIGVKFERWNINTAAMDQFAQSFVGGAPSWLQEDESPVSYGGSTELCFLAQLAEDFEFRIEIGAPSQLTLGINGKPRRSKNNFYRLFLGNQLYFFGTLSDEENREVYIITQRS
jgi:hypothetical protein